MVERPDVGSSLSVDRASPTTALRRRFGGFIEAALEGWLAMAGGTTAACPLRFPPF
jgi:hypothetical protein